MNARRLTFRLMCLTLGLTTAWFAVLPLQGQTAAQVAKFFEKFAWRPIGPAIMGGRTVDLEAVEANPSTIYAAVGPSGVWKSDNNGVTWTPVFYREATVSVGDLAIAQSSPNIVWVGTGEATCRNSVTIGDGVYKSTDGGKSWMNMGLRETRHISRILVSRGDPNVVYVAAMGHLWGPNPERGVFKTFDGGKTWTKILYVNENTGFADIAIDPADSQIIYAAAYEHRRRPWEYVSAGPGSGLYRSLDGGLTWGKLSKDLPEGLMGRIGIGVARSKPGVVYALIEHKDPGLWRSEDRGESWKRMCDAATFRRVNSRPFYYSQIFVDPGDDKTVYVLSTGLHVSSDMGQKFRAIGGGIHPDHHAFWIDPANPGHLVDGNDGGIDISYDGGKNWQAVQSLDAAEVYQVGVDMRDPYYVYVGLQDNGSWGGPGASLDPKGILNEQWFMVNGGDGFFVKPDPSDPMKVYANSQMNGLNRVDLGVGRGKAIRPAAPMKEPPYRFNWNAPVLISPHDPKTVYTGGNYLFVTTDGGQSWAKASPDLTTNDPAKMKEGMGPLSPENSGAEMHCTIVTIAESPVEKGVIWCGTDDGCLQLTRDGGLTWKNVVAAVPGLPRNTWCSRVEASHFDGGTAYASFDGHRSDDYSPYVFRTADYGKTWKSIRAGLPFGWVHVVREDPRNRNLLYVGTEFGIWASLDGGGSWFSLKNNSLPTVAVHDIAVHPRANDLIIGTHGRGVWILDDIVMLQEMSPDVLASDFTLFSLRPATQHLSASSGEPYSRPVFAGKNPAAGLGITVWLKADLKEKPRLTVIAADGKVVHEMPFNQQKAGIQREIWNLQFVPEARDGQKYSPGGGLAGLSTLPTIPPGEYTLGLTLGGKKYSQPFRTLPDPRISLTADVLRAQHEAFGDLLRVSRIMGHSVTAAKTIRRHLDSLQAEMPKKTPRPDSLEKALAEFESRFSPVEKDIVPSDMGIVQTTWETALRGGSPSLQLMMIAVSILSLPVPPTETEKAQLAEIIGLIESRVGELNVLIESALPRLNNLLTENGLPVFPKTTPIKI